MLRLFVLLISCGFLVACAQRHDMSFAPPAPNATVHDIWVANFRPTDPPKEGQRTKPRPLGLRYEMNQVSVPPTHELGEIEWPKGQPDAATDFVTVAQADFDDARGFVRAIDQSADDTILLFVHGYNMRHGEAVYQLAQVKHDFESPSPSVLFSWPSAGTPAGYIYDRDSVLIARDALEDVIVSLARQSRKKLIIMGHSLGNLLIMETLRQIEISGSLNIRQEIDAMFMVAPDIDGELFQSQAIRLRQLPEPSVIVATEQDKALRLSAWLTGRTNRLGSATDRSAVGDLPISVVDTSALARKGLNHSVPLTSPEAIAIFKRMNETQHAGDLDLPPLLELALEN